MLTELQFMRQQAKEQGETYFTVNQPCVKNHQSKRYVSNGQCVECFNSAQRTYRKNNLEYFAKFQQRVRDKNPEKARTYIRDYHRFYRDTVGGSENIKNAYLKHEEKLRKEKSE